MAEPGRNNRYLQHRNHKQNTKRVKLERQTTETKVEKKQNAYHTDTRIKKRKKDEQRKWCENYAVREDCGS